MRGWFVAVIAVVCLSTFGTMAFAQQANNQYAAVSVTESPDFYYEFFNVPLPDKTSFETDQEYQARIPKYTKGIVYLRVEPGCTDYGSYGWIIDKSYEYDLGKQVLTVRAGGKGLTKDFSSIKGGAFFAMKATVNPDKYSEAFYRDHDAKLSEKRTITEKSYDQYALNVLNGKKVPFDKYRRLIFRFEKLPRQEAANQADDWEIIVGVVPTGYQDRRVWSSWLHEAKADEPYSVWAQFHIVDVNMQEIILRRKSTGAIEKRIQIASDK